MAPHRKRLRHYDLAGHARALTFSCVRRRPLLEECGAYGDLGRAVSRGCGSLGYDLIAFVFMPEHVHLLVFPNEDPAVAPLLKSIKQGVSRVVKARLEHDDPTRVSDLAVLERPGKMAFRFWQEGAGYDRNITSAPALRHAIDYIHLNPVRRGLCDRAEEWEWSSAWQYLDRERTPTGDVPRVSRRFV